MRARKNESSQKRVLLALTSPASYIFTLPLFSRISPNPQPGATPIAKLRIARLQRRIQRAAQNATEKGIENAWDIDVERGIKFRFQRVIKVFPLLRRVDNAARVE